jgi:LysR family transcriptional regulator, cys regulon transcriptional activator
MNLTQLHLLREIVRQQIQLLEEELKLQIFQRHGKRLINITEPGQAIIQLAERVLRELDNIKRVGEEFGQQDQGTLSIATTHTQARYFLPLAVKQFVATYPGVQLSIHQGNPTQVAEQVASGEADIGIATEAINTDNSLVALPCYQWNRCLITPTNHPLLADTPLTLAKIAQFPLITYDFAFTGASVVMQSFQRANVEPHIVLTAIDADVIKTYVQLGLGVGLLANMAYDNERDSHLARLDASHLFPASTTYLGFHRNAFLRGYFYDFIQMLVPNLDKNKVLAAQQSCAS